MTKVFAKRIPVVVLVDISTGRVPYTDDRYYAKVYLSNKELDVFYGDSEDEAIRSAVRWIDKTFGVLDEATFYYTKDVGSWQSGG